MTAPYDYEFHKVELELTDALSQVCPGVNYIAASTSNDARFKREKCLFCGQRVATGDATISNDKVPGFIHVGCMRSAVQVLEGAFNSRQEWREQAETVEAKNTKARIAEKGYFAFLDETEEVRRQTGSNRKSNGRVSAMNKVTAINITPGAA